MKTRAIIQARMNSSRLPGKSLMNIGGVKLLQRVVNNVKELNFIDEVLVATTKNFEDDAIQSLSLKSNVKCFRGSEFDLLSRYTCASEDMEEIDNVVRVTADNPLIDFAISNELFFIHENLKSDYTCIKKLSHLACEIIRVKSLRRLNDMKDLTSYDREHVTPFFRNTNDESFNINMQPDNFLGLKSCYDKYLTVDTKNDFKRMESLIIYLENKSKYSLNNIYNWLKKQNYES